VTGSDAPRRIQLSDGRALAYSEYGDPNGRPVFYFHGFPSCRIEARVAHETAQRFGVRLIAIDRPGFGGSDAKDDREIADWPNDVKEVAAQLGIARFRVLGVSGGGPYVAACAAKIPELLQRAAIVSGWAPVDRPKAHAGLRWLTRATLALWRRIPALIYISMWWLALNARLFPRLVLWLSRRRLPEVDQEVTGRPAMRAMMYDALREVFRRGGRGPARELILFSRPWTFRPEDIAIEMLLWHGDADLTVPVSMGHYYAEAIPKCHATFVPGQGHFMVFDRFDEILGALIA
jgi:pimeloyl-ACP methyl ester carboxylesterase